MLYTGGSGGHGHSVVADGGGYVYTVDWYDGLNITRVRQSDMEIGVGLAPVGRLVAVLRRSAPRRRRWGLELGWGRYPKPSSKTVYLDKLHYGQTDSDSVYWLQTVLNGHTLEGGQELPLSGNYLAETDEEVRLCQAQHGYGDDPVNGSSVGPKQADHLFSDSYTIET